MFVGAKAWAFMGLRVGARRSSARTRSPIVEWDCLHIPGPRMEETEGTRPRKRNRSREKTEEPGSFVLKFRVS